MIFRIFLWIWREISLSVTCVWLSNRLNLNKSTCTVAVCLKGLREDNKTDQNWLWYIDLGIISILQKTKQQTDRSKPNRRCALCLHHCTLCYGNRLPSLDSAFHLNFFCLSICLFILSLYLPMCLSIYYFIILKFSPVSLFRALLDCKVKGWRSY